MSDDKDMLTIPAKVYRPSQDLLVDITSDEADKQFYMQTLAGDAVDGYSGIPGVGAKKAEAILGTTSMVVSRTGLPETWLVKRRRNPKRTTSSDTPLVRLGCTK